MSQEVPTQGERLRAAIVDPVLVQGGMAMLEEKLKEAIIGELQRQAADRPQSLRVENSDGLVVNGKIDIDDLVMVIAGSVAGGP